MRVPKENQMALEDIATLYGYSSNKVHTIIKTAYNKMVRYLVETKGENIFDAVMFLKNELRMTEKEAIEKLDVHFTKLIEKEAMERTLRGDNYDS
jgi:hypothetical protein